MAKDYYDVLGVSKSATADEIRAAYRKLARKYHPDVNKEAGAQKTFTEVQHAYDVLSDEAKRKVYDQFGAAAFEAGGAASAAGRAGDGGVPHYSWSNVGGARGGPAFNFEGVDFDTDDVGSVFEAIFGRHGEGAFPGTRGRSGKARARTPQDFSHAQPDEVRADITVSFMTAAKGGVEKVRIGEGGKTRTIEVTIPSGTEEGAQMRVRGAGAGQRDIILRVHVGGHPLLRRGEFTDTGKGLDLYLDLPVSIAEATLGGPVKVPTLTGPVELSVPPGTASGRRLRLRGRGIHDPQGRQGDLYAVIKIVPPSGQDLAESQRQELQNMAARGPGPRSGPEWSGSL
jgi:DnaJ-class molecular chaperone